MGGCVSSPEAPRRGHRRTRSAPPAPGKAYYTSRDYYRAPPPQYSHPARMRQARPCSQPVIQSVPPAYDSYRAGGHRKSMPAYHSAPSATYHSATPVASPKRVGFGIVEVREYRAH